MTNLTTKELQDILEAKDGANHKCPLCGDNPTLEYIHPPIPMRSFDWFVYCLGCCDGDPPKHRGYGTTPKEAYTEWDDSIEADIDSPIVEPNMNPEDT